VHTVTSPVFKFFRLAWLALAAIVLLGGPAAAQLVKGLEPEGPAPQSAQTAKAQPTQQSALPLPDVDITGAEADTNALRREIESLTRALEATSDFTLTTIEPLADLAAAGKRAADYRRRLDSMRTQMYLPDPRPDSRVTQALTAFQDRWGDLVRPMLDGEPAAPRLAADRWNGYAAQLDALYCDRVRTRAPADGMPLVGMAWACLADRFFRELADVELGVNGAITDRRRVLTAPAESALRKAEDSIAQTGSTIAFASSPALLLRNVTWQLFEAWRELAGLRLKELQAQERFRGSTPGFQWLLDISPVVRRREFGSETPIAVASGATLTVSIGADIERAWVATRGRTNLSRELHRLHYRLALLSLAQQEAGGERDLLETRRARTLQSIAEQAN
jgi:hypothetical protein